jgi:hypothetical protein
VDGGSQDPLSRGLSEKEAAARLKAEGPNALPQADRRTFTRIVFEILREPMFALLLLIELVQLAAGGRQITLQSPFAGATIGPFRVLSPHRDVYPVLLPQFDRTPDPDQKAIEATGWWIGKQPGMIARILERAKVKAQTWVTETWGKELLRDGGITSASNESSVVLYGDFGVGRRVLLTGDAGAPGLSYAA